MLLSHINYAQALSNRGNHYAAFQHLEKLGGELPKDHLKYADFLEAKNRVRAELPGSHIQQVSRKSKKKKRR